jgi:hypothetical protein
MSIINIKQTHTQMSNTGTAANTVIAKMCTPLEYSLNLLFYPEGVRLSRYTPSMELGVRGGIAPTLS